LENNRYFVLDVGTNTIRMLLADLENGEIRPLLKRRLTTRLGEGMKSSNLLGRVQMDRTISGIKSFIDDAERFKPGRRIAIGTHALRKAPNGPDFVSRVREETGMEIRVIPGDVEAKLSAAGVLSCIRNVGKSVIIDIGGGSTEVVAFDGREVRAEESISLGALMIHEEFIHSDPPRKAELEEAGRKIKTVIERSLGNLLEKIPGFSKAENFKLVGTAGTITTCAMLLKGLKEYDPSMINGAILARVRLEVMLEKLAGLTSERRRAFPGMDPGREDIIIPGIMILMELMDFTGRDDITVSDSGILEGAILRFQNAQFA